ncbi:hypothetical protein EJB05_01662 [Eragrostis curvula]|uniref:Uncharacterized protein n=1 Tax=Eragrostis curvula TaxID=38414 RepID=A0A5J9WQR3_9POAL|nr:hypothetical protein EJB05_01662 [Eragrostis curvula]
MQCHDLVRAWRAGGRNYCHSLCRHGAPNGITDLLQCHCWRKALPSTGWKGIKKRGEIVTQCTKGQDVHAEYCRGKNCYDHDAC